MLAYSDEDRSIGIVSDDRRVRTVARGLGTTVTGTIGVIVRAVEEGLSPQAARDLLEQIDTHGLHMAASFRQEGSELIDDAATDTSSE